MMSSISSATIDLTPLHNANIPVIVVLGGAGSGKGTQCSKLAEKYGFVHLSSGDVLRSVASTSTELGLKLRGVLNNGEMVDAETVLAVMKTAMINSLKDTKPKGFLIDGCPRTLDLARMFEKEIQAAKLVVVLKANRRTMKERLMKRSKVSGRADDQKEVIEKRIRSYFTDTMKVVRFYRRLRKVVEVDAKKSIEEVFSELTVQLDNIIRN
ncbi:Adenylate kinase isoenzyme 1 [Aphelenchoides besseyi]|nr:Adenylate kinase isoenzyme 1 [Aphelenchoides besseyi]KAI6179881.1 Adenylate kinase isoenzyme 1 [Aphelenchoides besseyi]KAI6208758.1 Adenylate kinase isoenzyme 1 [Aphelenchoides besseyi]KAI6208776.1 Adenylate kinase isoenzyme 1 [Aphelenchoides besseyi]